MNSKIVKDKNRSDQRHRFIGHVFCMYTDKESDGVIIVFYVAIRDK